MNSPTRPTDAQNQSMSLYLKHMQSIRLRLATVDDLVSGKLRCVNESVDSEIACLQVRKVLELIAFGSLVNHAETYSAAFADYTEHRKPKGLLKNLKKLHPDFYPKPVLVGERDDRGVRLLSDIITGYLTEDDFVLLHDRCSEALHEWNPFRPDVRVIRLERSLAEWVARIRRLLDVHYIRLIGSPDVWVVWLTNPETGTPSANFAAHVGDDPRRV